MQNNRSKEIKVGIVTLLAIAIAVFGITFAKNSGLSTSAETIEFIFPRSAGISNSAPITVNGVERGKVRSVENWNGKVKIIGAIDSKDDIKLNATAKIMILELTGGKKIEINPGNSSENIGKNPVKGVSVSDLSELVALVGDVSGDAISLIRRLDTLSLALNSLAKDTSFIENIRSAGEKANSLLTQGDSFLSENRSKLDNMIARLENLSEKLNSTVDKNEPKVSKLLDDIGVLVTDAKGLLNETDDVAENANVMIDNLNQIVEKIKTDESVINKLIYDEEFALKLDSAFSDFGSFIKLIEQYGVNVNLRIGTRP